MVAIIPSLYILIDIFFKIYFKISEFLDNDCSELKEKN